MRIKSTQLFELYNSAVELYYVHADAISLFETSRLVLRLLLSSLFYLPTKADVD